MYIIHMHLKRIDTSHAVSWLLVILFRESVCVSVCVCACVCVCVCVCVCERERERERDSVPYEPDLIPK